MRKKKNRKNNFVSLTIGAGPQLPSVALRSATACFTLLDKPTHHLYAPRFLSNAKHFLKLRGCGTGGSTLARPQRMTFVARTLSAEAPRSTMWRFRAAAAGPSK